MRHMWPMSLILIVINMHHHELTKVTHIKIEKIPLNGIYTNELSKLLCKPLFREWC